MTCGSCLKWLMAVMVSIQGSVMAFDAPEVTEGPLTLRLEAPSEVCETNVPQPVRVILRNGGGAPLEGTVRIEIVDAWEVEPAGPVKFRLAGNESGSLDFRIAAGEGTFNALYPVHAFAACTLDGAPLSAHAVYILETKLPDVPRPETAAPWQPVPLRPDSVLALAHLPMRGVVVSVAGEAPLVLPGSWEGSEGRTLASVQYGVYASRPDARESIAMHPPWRGGCSGSVLVEFPLRLPEKGPIRLTFANAIRDHMPEQGEPPSDGVTFRVRVAAFDESEGRLGEVLFERHTDAKTWQEDAVDLTAFAGKTICLQLESHPGPRNDTTCDQSFWAMPTLTAGDPQRASETRFAPARELGAIGRDGERYTVSVALGDRGILDGKVCFVRDKDRQIEFHGFSVSVLGDALEDENALHVLKAVEETLEDNGYTVRHRFEGWAGAFDLAARFQVGDGALRVHRALENAPEPKPWRVVYLENVAVGPWSVKVKRVYVGTGNVLDEPEAFSLAFDGHQCATSFAGVDFANGVSLVQGVDVPPSQFEANPETRHYTYHTPHTQRLTFIPCASVWEGARAWHDMNGLKPAGGVARAAGRFVFDLWGGEYAASAATLERAFRYGLTDSMVVWHNWQRWGYDYRLPDVFPPNPALGSLEEFQVLAEACKSKDVIFAPHDNYIDFYPDAEGYSYNHIAFARDGVPVRAWFNAGRGAQSYRWRADAVQPFLERNLRLIKEQIAPTGYFIDVWSSIGPYDYWTQDGQFFDRVYTRTRWGEYFAWIRDLLGEDAPQISESGHDQLIGWVDGAQTNHLRVDPNPPKEGWTVWRVRAGDAERTPWFDAAHHDRFVLHGAGYSSRYQGGLDAPLHGIYSDDYMATEVLTGHPAMVSEPFGRDVVRKYWLLHRPMRALALRRIEAVEFADGDIHRQHVRWDNGADVWVNRGRSDWTVGECVLPEYGFLLRAPLGEGVIEAAVARVDGVIVEWCRGPEEVYVNARPVVRDRLPVKVSLESLRYVGQRTCEVTLVWEAARPLEETYRVFVHAVDAQDAIRFQGDHTPDTPTTEWSDTVRTTARMTLPETCRPGDTFELYVGLWIPGSGERAPLAGSDEQRRVHLGTLTLASEEGYATDLAWTPFVAPADPLLARLNTEGKEIDFGPFTTNGACRITYGAFRGSSSEGTTDESGITVTPLPDSTPFLLRIDWPRAAGDAPLPRYCEAVAQDGVAGHCRALEEKHGILTLRCEPGAFAYRLAAP